MNNHYENENTYFNDSDDYAEYDEDRSGCNSRESLLCLFINDILIDNSTALNPISQETIIRKLDRYPYSISVDRKTISRTINTLVSEFPYFYKGDQGIWFDRQKAS